MSYDFNQVTTMFDTLATKAESYLDKQFDKGRIKGTEYSAVFSNLMNTIIQVSVDIPLKDVQVKNGDKDLEVKNKNIEQLTAQTNLTNKQIELIDKQKEQIDEDIKVKERQLKGFDDRIKTDLFKSQLDSWSMMFASGMLGDDTSALPDIINNDEVSDLYNNMKAGLR